MERATLYINPDCFSIAAAAAAAIAAESRKQLRLVGVGQQQPRQKLTQNTRPAHKACRRKGEEKEAAGATLATSVEHTSTELSLTQADKT